ncbi:MAG: hypothetical protein M1415_11265, partial [Firmicutes bacterium]|nr:hypothetical protein [Bacillota bacterium]
FAQENPFRQPVISLAWGQAPSEASTSTLEILVSRTQGWSMSSEMPVSSFQNTWTALSGIGGQDRSEYPTALMGARRTEGRGLWAAAQAAGYPGSRVTVQRWMTRHRRQPTGDSPPADRSLGQSRPGI